ncbi:MAG: shikimate kinase [Rhodospirillaceae bacterium]|nr:shikimate kinase [Rhodospirillaceae bacterium]
MKGETPTTVALVGLMGAGKSAIGRRLASRLTVPFFDSDAEIEAETGMTIAEMFEQEGEAAFRVVERAAIKRLLSGPTHVLATGGGAFIETETRAELRGRVITVWLRADLEVLFRRVCRKNDRPLLKQKNPKQVLADLVKVRYPLYALADITVDSNDRPHEEVVDRIIDRLTVVGSPLVGRLGKNQQGAEL